MGMREKLIELLGNNANCIELGIEGCEECRYARVEDCYTHALVDHLIANGVTIQRWIPVTEMLPEKYGKYLCRYVFNGSAEYPHIEAISYYPTMTRFQGEGSCGMRVTHWMPLPEPPVDQHKHIPNGDCT